MHKIISFIIFLWPFFAYSQSAKIIPVDSLGREILPDTNTSGWMGKDDIDMLKTIKVNYKKPESFLEVPGYDCFKGKGRLEAMLSCLRNQLRSKDGEFITFIPLNRFHTKKDSVNLRRSFPEMFISDLNLQHVYQIRAVILYSLGKDATLRGENSGFDWKRYVHYYSDEKAIQKFNADTAITFVIKLNDNEVYKEKYKYLKALYLQKKDRGFIELYCFYTDQGNKHLPKYWQAVEGIFKYED